MDPKVFVIFLLAVLLGAAASRARGLLHPTPLEAFADTLLGDSVHVLCSQLDLDNNPDAKAACDGIDTTEVRGCIAKDARLRGCKGMVITAESGITRYPEDLAVADAKGDISRECMVARSMFYEKDTILRGDPPRLLINYRRLARVFLVQCHVCVPLKVPAGATADDVTPSEVDIDQRDLEMAASSFPSKLRVGESERYLPDEWWASSDDGSALTSVFQQLVDESPYRYSQSVIFPRNVSANLEYDFLTSVDPETGVDGSVKTDESNMFSSALARSMSQVSVHQGTAAAFLYQNQPQYVPVTFAYRFRQVQDNMSADLPFDSTEMLRVSNTGVVSLENVGITGGAVGGVRGFELRGTDNISVLVTLVVAMRTGDVIETMIRGKDRSTGPAGRWFCMRTKQALKVTEQSVSDCEQQQHILEGVFYGIVLDHD